jgi:exodeoxyribonuclease VII small subunit
MVDPEKESTTFEQMLEDLESIVDRLGAEDLELDEALSQFERGVARLRDAGRLLDAAEGRVEDLIEAASGDLEAIGFDIADREESGGSDRA